MRRAWAKAVAVRFARDRGLAGLTCLYSASHGWQQPLLSELPKPDEQARWSVPEVRRTALRFWCGVLFQIARPEPSCRNVLGQVDPR